MCLLLPPHILKQLNQNYLEFLVVVDEFWKWGDFFIGVTFKRTFSQKS